jgi:hypothetical protein
VQPTGGDERRKYDEKNPRREMTRHRMAEYGNRDTYPFCAESAPPDAPIERGRLRYRWLDYKSANRVA